MNINYNILKLLVENKNYTGDLNASAIHEWLIREHNLFIEVIVSAEDGAYPMFVATIVNLATLHRTPVMRYSQYSYHDAMIKSIETALSFIK